MGVNKKMLEGPHKKFDKKQNFCYFFFIRFPSVSHTFLGEDFQTIIHSDYQTFTPSDFLMFII